MIAVSQINATRIDRKVIMDERLQGWITTAEGAKLTGYTSRNIRKLANRKLIGSIRITGRTMLVSADDLLAYTRKQGRVENDLSIDESH